ncbi:hypothetical protein DAT35_55680 [Vitiosangium sp. GDMCC 1.1324]|nr:hypothetical protein DAT35_55680 [Vitiosangium sp. GDMCC 1.1324]
MNTLITALVAFTFGFIGSMPLAGPIAVLVFSTSAQKQYGTALRIGLGAALAVAIYASVAFWGFSTFLANRPAVLPVSHGLSALVLTVLGVHFARWKPRDEQQPARGHNPHLQGFLLGFTIAALNPTLLATWSTAVAFLYSQQLVAFSGLLALPFGAAAGAGVASWELVFVGLLRRYQSRFSRQALAWMVRGMGVLLLVGGVITGIELVRELVSPPGPSAHAARAPPTPRTGAARADAPDSGRDGDVHERRQRAEEAHTVLNHLPLEGITSRCAGRGDSEGEGLLLTLVNGLAGGEEGAAGAPGGVVRRTL